MAPNMILSSGASCQHCVITLLIALKSFTFCRIKIQSFCDRVFSRFCDRVYGTLSFKMCKSENHFYKETFVPVQLGRAEVRTT